MERLDFNLFYSNLLNIVEDFQSYHFFVLENCQHAFLEPDDKKHQHGTIGFQNIRIPTKNGQGKYCGIFSDLLFIGKVTNNHTISGTKRKIANCYHSYME